MQTNLCRKEYIMKKIAFMGTPDFSVPILERLIEDGYEIELVVTQPDRPKGRKRTLTASPVKEAALAHNLNIFQPENLKASYEDIFKYDIDIIITAAYGQLLPNELLEYPEYGSINVHASLLPELRGGAPIHYSILQGKKETGITIMYMVEKLDAGNIISQQAIPIEETDHVGILHDKLSIVGAELLSKTLPDIFNRTNQSVKQDESKATFAPNISRELERINWHDANDVVYNHIRGLHPWPVAYTTYKQDRMKIWWAELDNKIYEAGQPGEIIKKDEVSFTVLCGNKKAVKITNIQPAGKRKMSVEDFLRGADDLIEIGEVME